MPYLSTFPSRVFEPRSRDSVPERSPFNPRVENVSSKPKSRKSRVKSIGVRLGIRQPPFSTTERDGDVGTFRSSLIRSVAPPRGRCSPRTASRPPPARSSPRLVARVSRLTRGRARPPPPAPSPTRRRRPPPLPPPPPPRVPPPSSPAPSASSPSPPPPSAPAPPARATSPWSAATADLCLDARGAAGAYKEPGLGKSGTTLFQSDLIASAYENGWRQSFAWAGFPGEEDEARYALDYMRDAAAGGVLLDVSCGSGLFSRRFAAPASSRTSSPRTSARACFDRRGRTARRTPRFGRRCDAPRTPRARIEPATFGIPN